MREKAHAKNTGAIDGEGIKPVFFAQQEEIVPNIEAVGEHADIG